MTRADTRARLIALLKDLGPDRIWRPVYDDDGTLLFGGKGWEDDGLPEDVPGLSFAGKRVVDLGCNLGEFTFLARRRGAAKAVGIDVDAGVIEGAELMRELNGLDGVEFRALDFLGAGPEPGDAFDMGMMIDILGKGIIAKGKVYAFVDAMRRFGGRELFFTFRPKYHVKKVLGMAEAEVDRLYPGGYVREGRFHLIDCVRDRLGPDYDMAVLTRETVLDRNYKYMILFTRRDG